MIVVLTVVAAFAAAPSLADSVGLPTQPVVIDGNLREWGGATWIDIAPAGEGVGLRGVFDDDDDHDAVALLQWDAEFLYLAAAVTDDTLDAGRVAPDEREWQGSGGQRKDRLFYFDHMKVFLREPGADAGYNLWFSPPTDEDPQVYWWGGRQRRGETIRPPIEVAGQVRGTSRTFEMAIPWTWMEAYPQPGEALDAMVLFTDSDRPGEQVALKISREQDRWIWWQGKLELSGQPEGLRPRPKVEAPKRRVAPQPTAVVDDRVAQAIARSRAAADSVKAAAAVAQDDGRPAAPTEATETAPTAASSAPVPISAGAAPSTEVQQATSGTSAPARSGLSLRARLNRQLLARRTAPTPDFLRTLERDEDLSDAQVDTFYTVLRRKAEQIVDQGITSRLDFFVVDLASAAECRRDQSRGFLVQMFNQLASADNPVAVAWVSAAADAAQVDPAQAARFSRTVCLTAADVLKDLGVTTSEELIRQGRKESGLNDDEAQRLMEHLLRP